MILSAVECTVSNMAVRGRFQWSTELPNDAKKRALANCML